MLCWKRKINSKVILMLNKAFWNVQGILDSKQFFSVLYKRTKAFQTKIWSKRIKSGINLELFVCSLNSTWRCGVFLPEPDTVGEPPLAKYFVLQNHFPASCPATFKQTYKKGTFSKKCTELVGTRHLYTGCPKIKEKNHTFRPLILGLFSFDFWFEAI